MSGDRFNPARGPVRVLLDTDIGPDCDDAGALALLHVLADRGEAEIVGVMHDTSSPWGAGCIDAINAYYGRPALPVGTLKEEGLLTGDAYETYNKWIALHYPNRYPDGLGVPDAVRLYRELLAAEEHRSVTVTAIGPLRNLRLLLESGPDEYSPLDGADLIAAKVDRLVVMGGVFPSGEEWNFQQDALSASAVCERWPTPILFCGYEIGAEIRTGGRLFEAAPLMHPVRQAYARFLGGEGSRSSWDLAAVLAAVRGCCDYWDARTDGFAIVDERGGNRWIGCGEATGSGVAGVRGYLLPKMDGHALARLLDELLVSPRRSDPETKKRGTDRQVDGRSHSGA